MNVLLKFPFFKKKEKCYTSRLATVHFHSLINRSFSFACYLFKEPGSAPKNVQVRPLSSTTMLIQWEEPDTPNGQVIVSWFLLSDQSLVSTLTSLDGQAYKVFYTTNPSLPTASWDSQVVDNNLLTTISDLTPHTIYTIRVQAETSIGSGPLSTPVQVKTQQGVPSQPTGLRAIDVNATSVSLEWARPHHTGENVNSYELYWNDTFTKVDLIFLFHGHWI